MAFGRRPLGVDGERSAIPREYVVGQGDEGIAFPSGWEGGQAALCTVGVFDRALESEVRGPMLAEEPEDLAPLFRRHGAVADDATDEAIRFLAAVAEEQDDRQRHFPLSEIPTNRL